MKKEHKMIFRESIQDIIKKRKSVRTYSKKEIEQEKRNYINDCMEDLSGDDYRFVLMDFNNSQGIKLSTYGMIKGASTYMVGILSEKLANDKKASASFGYAFEELVLKATDLGLGTCWMAATFNSKDITRIISLKDEEQIVMVSPIGYEEERSSIEKISRFLAKSDKRKPWKELFFKNDFNKHLKKDGI
jgi:nitroreductase